MSQERRFDDLIEQLRPIAVSLVDAGDDSLSQDCHVVKGLLCLIMGYADQVPEKDRPMVAEAIALACLPLHLDYMHTYAYPEVEG